MGTEQWEKELEEIISDYCPNVSELIKLTNFIQKERVITKIKENQQWSLFFKSEKINKPEIAKVFDAMVIKYGSILERF